MSWKITSSGWTTTLFATVAPASLLPADAPPSWRLFQCALCRLHPVTTFLQLFDELLRDTLSAIVGWPVPDLDWSQSHLPIKDCGSGVRQARDQWILAFLGCSFQSAHFFSFLIDCDQTDNPEFLCASNEARDQFRKTNLSAFAQKIYKKNSRRPNITLLFVSFIMTISFELTDFVRLPRVNLD